MPFGSFYVEEIKGKSVRRRERSEKIKKEPVGEQRDTHPSQEAVQEKTTGIINTVNILFIGRNLSIIQEFLCSMNQNMGETLASYGFAFYTQDLSSITDIITRKKRLERYCWSFDSTPWTYDYDTENYREYKFDISPSGDQSRAVELHIRCVTPEGVQGHMSWGQTDAVWMICDGALLQAEGDEYTGFLRQLLAGIPKQDAEKPKPVCLILSQIEQLGHFDGPGDQSCLPAEVSGQLVKLCRDEFASNSPVAVIPVQVYGGMECAGLDDKGWPILRIGQNSFYQTYMPDNCQIPCLYTLQMLCNPQNSGLFGDANDGEFLRSISSHYGGKFRNPQWVPDMLGDEVET